MWWAWYVLYMGASLFIQIFMPRRFANGLSGKIFKKRVKSQFGRHSARYYLWLLAFWLMFRPSWFSYTRIWDAFWAVAALFIVDDYIFGKDDTWKKLWAGAKNKIKWKMDLPPEPARQEVA